MPPSSTAAMVGEIPVLWVEPTAAPPNERRQLIIWLPGFSGTKESTLGQLEAFAADGFVAMSFDMPEHGERLIDADAQALATRVRSNLRTFFWAILAQSAADFSALIDWAVETLGVEPRVAVGGQSAGGDAAVAATGLDDRIACCVTSVSTPDWKRPGSWEPPGAPDAASQAAFDRASPFTAASLQRFRTRRPAIAFHCGADDDQVPSEAACRFVFGELAPAYAAAGVSGRLAVKLWQGLGHGGGVMDSAEEEIRGFLQTHYAQDERKSEASLSSAPASGTSACTSSPKL